MPLIMKISWSVISWFCPQELASLGKTLSIIFFFFFVEECIHCKRPQGNEEYRIHSWWRSCPWYQSGLCWFAKSLLLVDHEVSTEIENEHLETSVCWILKSWTHILLLYLFSIIYFYCTLQRYWSMVSWKLRIIHWIFINEHLRSTDLVAPLIADSGVVLFFFKSSHCQLPST